MAGKYSRLKKQPLKTNKVGPPITTTKPTPITEEAPLRQGTDAETLAIAFYTLMGSDSAYRQYTTGWIREAQRFLDTTGMSLDEAHNFIRWATTENVSDDPRFNSVLYIHQSRDPFDTMMKHLETLLRSYRARMVTKKAVEKTAKLALGVPGRDPWLDTPAGMAWDAEQERKYPVTEMELPY